MCDESDYAIGAVLGQWVDKKSVDIYYAIRTDRKDWSTKLIDALWAYQTAYKAPIGTTPYRLVYERIARKLALCEIDNLKDEAYDCASAYKSKMKKVHDANNRLKNFEVGQKVWLYNKIMKIFPGKLKSKWTGPYLLVGFGNHGQF
ncbi:uncharacterized protein LOC143600403 [Bidens hawaiensis]|uniref:uncharacterized protein LOC143600403 n=1 Tax=Bidens hawaiensis TaxID=980011 RepID=UPI00404B4708